MICIETVDTTVGPMAVIACQENIKTLADQCARSDFEIHVTDWMLSKPVDLFIDVGAAWGYHSMMAWKHNIQAVAIEACPIRAAVCRWNAIGCFDVREIAVSDEPVCLPSVAGKMASSHADNRACRTAPLDSLNTNDLSTAIKIDVEGHEIGVLRSADGWMNRDNVRWCVEVHGTADEVRDIFERHGYRVIQVKNHLLAEK